MFIHEQLSPILPVVEPRVWLRSLQELFYMQGLIKMSKFIIILYIILLLPCSSMCCAEPLNTKSWQHGRWHTADRDALCQLRFNRCRQRTPLRHWYSVASFAISRLNYLYMRVILFLQHNTSIADLCYRRRLTCNSIYIYIYIYVCVCVCVGETWRNRYRLVHLRQ